MRVFFDTEFIENGVTIDLISVGMVREDGETLYLVSNEYDRNTTDHWIRENVLAYIPHDVDRHPKQHIADLIDIFLADIEKPEFWAYYADYDWVAFCQLYGRMIDLPEKYPRYCRDLKQLADDLGIKLPEQTEGNHHALADARWIAEAFAYCQAVKVNR